MVSLLSDPLQQHVERRRGAARSGTPSERAFEKSSAGSIRMSNTSAKKTLSRTVRWIKASYQNDYLSPPTPV